MDTLKKYLDKIGVTEFSELSQEEKDTYRDWDNALSGRKISDEDVAEFLTTEEQDVINKLKSMKLEKREDIFLKMKLEFIGKIKTFLMSPELEKQMVKRNIENIIKN